MNNLISNSNLSAFNYTFNFIVWKHIGYKLLVKYKFYWKLKHFLSSFQYFRSNLCVTINHFFKLEPIICNYFVLQLNFQFGISFPHIVCIWCSYFWAFQWLIIVLAIIHNIHHINFNFRNIYGPIVLFRSIYSLGK